MKDFAKREPKKPKTIKTKGWCPDQSIINAKPPKDDKEQEKIQLKKFRCPTCGKRLKPRAYWDVNIFDYWKLPAHKQK